MRETKRGWMGEEWGKRGGARGGGGRGGEEYCTLPGLKQPCPTNFMQQVKRPGKTKKQQLIRVSPRSKFKRH